MSMKTVAGPSPPVEVAFDQVDVEGQPVALELGRLQHDHDVDDAGLGLVEHRHGGVGRVLGEAVGGVDRSIPRADARSAHGRRRGPAGRRRRWRWATCRPASACCPSSLAPWRIEHDHRRHDLRLLRPADGLGRLGAAGVAAVTGGAAGVCAPAGTDRPRREAAIADAATRLSGFMEGLSSRAGGEACRRSAR